jgi:hypothetical protein
MWTHVLVLCAAPLASDARTLLVLPFAAEGAPQHHADTLQDAFVDAAMRTPGVTVVPPGAVPVLTTSLRAAGWTPGTEPAAVLALTPLAHADQVVRAQVSLEAGSVRATLELLDATTGALEKTAQRLLPLGGDAAISMRGAAAELLRPAAFRGAVRVSCPSPGVTLLVGTESLGECRDAMDITDLVPGTHAVRARKEGHAEALQRVEVEFDRTTHVDALETEEGLRLDVPRAAPSPAPGPPAVAATPAHAPGPAAPPSSHRLDPRVQAGLGVAAAGATLAVFGIGLAVASVILTGAWPRYEDDGTVRPLADVENGALLSVRVYGTLALIPLGLVVALAGLGALCTGVGLAVLGFTQGE